jgi:hypothetical protein
MLLRGCSGRRVLHDLVVACLASASKPDPGPQILEHVLCSSDRGGWKLNRVANKYITNIYKKRCPGVSITICEVKSLYYGTIACPMLRT